MNKELVLALVVLVGVPCVWGFARWERHDKALRAVVFLLVLELVEAALYENESLIPRGLFHPGSGSTQLRLPEIFITLALLGRLAAKKLPKRIGVPALVWVAFGVWLAVEAVEGYQRGNIHSQVLYQAKAIIYVVGGFALASGVPARKYIEAQVFERIARWFAPFLLVLDLLAASHKTYALHFPLVPDPTFGSVGSDAGSMFGAIGLIALLLELRKQRRSTWTLVSTLPLLVCTLLAGQRAALIGVAASVGLLLLIALGPSARHRLNLKSAEMLLAAIVVVAVTVLVIVAPAALRQQPPKIPFSSTINVAFNSEQKIESAQDRVNEFAAARKLIPQHVFLGWGLGLEYKYWAPGPNVEITSALTEDIYTDLWVRTGLIGLGLFVVAALLSLGDGIGVWRRDSDRAMALLAMALVAAILGLLVKGGFESDFENYGLATILGLLLGMLRSTVTSVRSGVSPQRDPAERVVNERF